MTTYKPDDWLTEKQAAEVLGLKPSTLRKWRQLRTGPAFERYTMVGKRLGVRYRYQDLLDWQKKTHIVERVEPER